MSKIPKILRTSYVHGPFLKMYQHYRGSSQIGSQMDIFQRGKELELERKLRSIENQVG